MAHCGSFTCELGLVSITLVKLLADMAPTGVAGNRGPGSRQQRCALPTRLAAASAALVELCVTWRNHVTAASPPQKCGMK